MFPCVTMATLAVSVQALFIKIAISKNGYNLIYKHSKVQCLSVQLCITLYANLGKTRSYTVHHHIHTQKLSTNICLSTSRKSN